jgi:flagellar motor switch protein FliG
MEAPLDIKTVSNTLLGWINSKREEKEVYDLNTKYLSEDDIQAHRKAIVNTIKKLCAKGELNKVPQSLLREDLLEDLNPDGNSAIHHAVTGGCLNMVPKDILMKNIFTINHENHNILDLLAAERIIFVRLRSRLKHEAKEALQSIFKEFDNETLKEVKSNYPSFEKLIKKEQYMRICKSISSSPDRDINI